jgi:RNA polymerase sigma-70 factor, ECF subfamily
MRATDEQLVEAFQNGDAAAFDTLLGRWDVKIRGAIYRLVGPNEDVRDLCQETFLKAYRGLGSFKKEARFSSWLYQIAVNTCRDRQRRRRGRTLVSLDEVDTSDARLLPAASAIEVVEGRDLSRLVAAAVEALPADQREVIVLKEYEGLTFLEIADTLDLPISTVKTRLYRGLGQLRQRLERQGIRAAAPIVAPTP